MTKVAWLETPDRLLTLDVSSLCDRDLETPDVDGLISVGEPSRLTAFAGTEARLLSPDISVSGGLGGRDDFFDVEPLRDPSADLDRESSASPKSVGSGVNGASLLDGERSSRLITASLLCALLNEGYGNDTRFPLRVDLEGDAATSLTEPILSL